MGDVSTIGDIGAKKPIINGRPDPTEPLNYFQDVRDVGAGWADENIFGLGFKYIVDASVAQNDTEFVEDPNYNIFNDFQIKGFEPYVGNFLHSKSAKQTKRLITDFVEDSKKANGSPSYIVGRVLGGLTDPSSLFMFTKGGSFLFTGSRLLRSGKVGSLITTEEFAKQGLSDTRTWEETAIISASGFLLPAIFPAINNKLAGKQFDDTANKLDNMDTHYSNSQYVGGGLYKDGSVGAGATGPIRTEAEWIAANQIKPTGMGILGEKSGFTPIFRVLNKGGLDEQDFITTVLESPLLTKGNFEGVVSGATIERKIKSRHYMIKISDDAVMSEYNTYLKRLGKNEQNIFEKTINTKIGTGMNKTGVMTPREFSSAVTRARLDPNLAVEPEVRAAAKHTEDLFYGPLGKEYAESEISISWHTWHLSQIEKYISFMDGSIKGRKAVTNPKKLEQLNKLITTKRKIENKLELLKKGKILRKNYINPLYKRDAIDANPELFKRIMQEELEKQGLSKVIIDDIIESFMQYQPTLRLKSIDEQLSSVAKFTDEGIEEVNKISSRFLGRELNIDYTRLMKEGFMEDDVMLLQRHYFNQVVPDIELTKVFGDPMGYGSRWSADGNYQQGILQIVDNMLRKNGKYDKYYNQLGDINEEPLQNFLTKQQIQNIKDLDASIHLTRGTYGLAQDPNRTFSRGLRMMKLYNATTMLTGIAQVVDTARLVMINGMGKTFKIQTEMFQSGMAKEILKMSKNSTQLGGEALDMIDSSRAMGMYGMEDAFGVFNKMERGMSKVGNVYFTFLNASNPWNASVKTMAGFFNGTRIIENVEKIALGKSISKLNRARLNFLGIDDTIAREIYKQYQKHGVGKNGKISTKADGNDFKHMRVANSDSWDDTVEARKAAEIYHQGLSKQVNVDIVTPSKGDVPLWANSEMGGALAQFKKFGAAATQRMLMRGLQEKDTNFMQGILLLMGAGMMVDAFRQKQFNRDYSKKPFGQKIVDGFDRSGLGGIFSDINNAIERLGNNQVGLRPLLGGKKPYGTYKDILNNPIPDVLGPTANQITNIADIMWTWGTGKYNHHTARNVRRLVPFQNVWFLDSVFDKLEKDVLR
tara:strand:- start:546 stop:3842 length:3297 start_codon:yes stop_codon:yes gene_type:complete